MSDTKDSSEKKGSWLGTTIVMLGLGSLGPANVFYFATDPTYMDKMHGWRVLLLPFGVWLLTGFLLQGLTVLWAGGVKRDADWQLRGERAWEWWCKLGLWLVGIGVGLFLAALAFGGIATFLSSLDRGTLLIGGLLFMILMALWRIGDQMRRR